MNGDMAQCIANCAECHRVCLETMVHCLGMGGRHAAAAHQTLLADCAEICRTSEDFMARGSERHRLTCGVCAEVCRRCAEECTGMAAGGAQMTKCAEVCRRCAESCRKMSA